jgi:hypothetical protein
MVFKPLILVPIMLAIKIWKIAAMCHIFFLTSEELEHHIWKKKIPALLDTSLKILINLGNLTQCSIVFQTLNLILGFTKAEVKRCGNHSPEEIRVN